MELLRELSISVNEKLRRENRVLFVFPGHGDYYPVKLLYS